MSLHGSSPRVIALEVFVLKIGMTVVWHKTIIPKV